MPLSDIATITVTTTGAGVTRAGYGVPLITSFTASWAERYRTYSSLSAVAADFAANSPEYLAANAVFSQSPRLASIVIGRCALQPTQAFSIGVNGSALNTPYKTRHGIATGVAWKEQDATYNSGGGATGWVASNTWSMGDIIVGATNGLRLYSCLGQSGAQGLTGIGSTMGPSGIGAAIPEGQVFWMFIASGVTGGFAQDGAIVGLQAKIRALASPPVVGTGTGQLTDAVAGSQGARTLTLTANAAANFHGLQVYNRAALSSAQDHSNPGIATDLAAIKNAYNSWYGLITTFNSEAVINAAAAWVESNTKLYVAATMDSAVATVTESGSATDVGHDNKASAYARTAILHHPSNDDFADAAEIGKFFPISPGGETWRMKTLAGVTVETYTDSEVTNLLAKRCQFYYAIGGRNAVGGDALTGSGEYIDVTRFIDWYTSELQVKLANLAIGVNKIPFTNEGTDMIEAKIRQQNKEGQDAGGISKDVAPVITIPDVADVSSEDKAARELGSVQCEWTLAGAIHHITVSVTASV